MGIEISFNRFIKKINFPLWQNRNFFECPVVPPWYESSSTDFLDDSTDLVRGLSGDKVVTSRQDGKTSETKASTFNVEFLLGLV